MSTPFFDWALFPAVLGVSCFVMLQPNPVTPLCLALCRLV